MVSVTPRLHFALGKGPLVPIVQEAGWASEPVWTQRLGEKSFAPAGDRTSIAQSIVSHYTDWATPAPIPGTYPHSSLMMEAVCTSETSVDNHFTRQYNPEDSSEHYSHLILGTLNNLDQCLSMCSTDHSAFRRKVIAWIESDTEWMKITPIHVCVKIAFVTLTTGIIFLLYTSMYFWEQSILWKTDGPRVMTA
jgi:hypothetical protein